MSKIITSFQGLFFQKRRTELIEEIDTITNYLNNVDDALLEKMCNLSMELLKDCLARRYQGNTERIRFDEEDLWKNSNAVLREYPVVISTTFSSRTSLSNEVIYDYVIMDEASQVDITTGALALVCARNAVVVGDSKQLPNVVAEITRKEADSIFSAFHLPDGYRYSNSFLQSILMVIPDVRQTMLREHYRCHPQIINFCNEKFYQGNLVIMTEDAGEKDVLMVVKTVEGNHQREHYSQRQIDIIKNEILPSLKDEKDEIGIISPYKNQVEALTEQLDGIDVATVHKFQGREKDTIILSTVDDEISDFTDDPYLLNVAVSRAKKRLILVVSGNEQKQERNISDLIAYIQYHNFEVRESEIYSIFDYLYQQYTDARYEFLKKQKRISEYDSENLMYQLIQRILLRSEWQCYNVVCHFPLNMLIRDPKLLNERECQYAMNPATHLDFLIFNRVSKQPILAIEVDGFHHHRKGTEQADRDVLKNHILELYQIPLLRLPTNGSAEQSRIVQKLHELTRR